MFKNFGAVLILNSYFYPAKHSLMLLKGVLLGISLSFMVGPLLFSVVEASIVRGFRAGVAVAAGIWSSDFLFIGLILWSLDLFTTVTSLPDFRFWAEVLGGMMLIVFGIVSFFSKPKAPKNTSRDVDKANDHPYFRLWLRGFFINLINPGTIFFWLGIVSALVAPNHWTNSQSLTFLGGMISVLIVTDTLKAWGARSIRHFLTPQHIRQVQRTIGMVLAVFGLVLLLQAVGGDSFIVNY